MLRNHEVLLFNWFRAKGELSSCAVEGLNNIIRVITRRSYGFRTFKAMEIPSIKHLDDFRNRKLPTDSAEEAEREVETRHQNFHSKRCWPKSHLAWSVNEVLLL
jgi:hypothetical protein